MSTLTSVTAPLTPIDPEGIGRVDYDVQLFGWDVDLTNFFDKAFVS